MVIPAMDRCVEPYIYLYAPTADSFAAKIVEMATVVIRITTDKSPLSVPIICTLIDIFPQWNHESVNILI